MRPPLLSTTAAFTTAYGWVLRQAIFWFERCWRSLATTRTKVVAGCARPALPFQSCDARMQRPRLAGESRQNA
eukprot:3052536-Pyramimonas_sp.AAC.1